MKRIIGIGASALFVVLAGCGPENRLPELDTKSVYLHQTMRAITDRIVYDIFSPPVASRIYTYVSVAGYEAAIAGSASYESMAGQLRDLAPIPAAPDKRYSRTLAAVQAMYRVGRTLIFSEDQLDAFYERQLEEIRGYGLSGDEFDRSVAFGEEVARHILAWAEKDNYKQTRSFAKYSISRDPATWRPTPPAYMEAIEPSWNKIRPFVIDSAQQFKPEPPTPFSTQKGSKFYNEALEVFETVNTLTDEQREIAFFWDCNPFMMNVRGHVMFAAKKISPGGHWINITRLACTQAKKNVQESTEAYLLVSLALADGFISCWDEKYRSKLIRPESYINQYIDENWLPVLQTPPFPEHTSGHSVISSASAVVLTQLLGASFSYADSTEVVFGLPVRHYTSFQQAAEEAAISRLYGGIHYRPAIEEGVREGRRIGEFIIRKIRTKPVKDL